MSQIYINTEEDKCNKIIYKKLAYFLSFVAIVFFVVGIITTNSNINCALCINYQLCYYIISFASFVSSNFFLILVSWNI